MVKLRLRFYNDHGYLIGAYPAIYDDKHNLVTGKIIDNRQHMPFEIATSSTTVQRPTSYMSTQSTMQYDIIMELNTNTISYIEIPYFSPYEYRLTISVYKNEDDLKPEDISDFSVPSDKDKTINKEYCRSPFLGIGIRKDEQLGLINSGIDKEMKNYEIQDSSFSGNILFDGSMDDEQTCDWTSDSDYIIFKTERVCNLWIHQPDGLGNSNIGINKKNYRYMYNEYTEDVPHYKNWRMLIKVLNPGTYRLAKDSLYNEYNAIDEIYFEVANSKDITYPEETIIVRLNSNIYKNLFPEIPLDMEAIMKKIEITPSSFNEVNQPNHGFKVNDILYKISDNKYGKAIADGTNKSKIAGMVTKVYNENKFTIMDTGIYPYMHLPYKDTTILYLSDRRAGTLGHYLDMFDKIYIPVAIYTDDKIILNIQGGISGTLLHPYSDNNVTMEFETYQPEEIEEIIKAVLNNASTT